jgi:hypothetical protein
LRRVSALRLRKKWFKNSGPGRITHDSTWSCSTFASWIFFVIFWFQCVRVSSYTFKWNLMT